MIYCKCCLFIINLIMKISDVAKKINLSKETVRRYVKTGKLKATLINTGNSKLSNTWYITDEQLEDYLKQYNDN